MKEYNDDTMKMVAVLVVNVVVLLTTIMIMIMMAPTMPFPTQLHSMSVVCPVRPGTSGKTGMVS